MRIFILVVLILLVGDLVPSPARAGFDLEIAAPGLSLSERNAIDAAEQIWESVILGYAPGISRTGLQLSAQKVSVDGAGGFVARSSLAGSVIEGGYAISTGGSILIDTSDINQLVSTRQLTSVVAHEIGHLLGFGTLWVDNGVYVEDSGQYTGSHGLQAYRNEFDAAASFVPVELDGGESTSNSHWDKLTSIFDLQGRPLANELMTGFLGDDPFLSQTTIQSLQDLGFSVAAPIVYLSGDFDFDKDVDGRDLLAWQRREPTQPRTMPDLTDWQSNYGTSLSIETSAVAVPEPRASVLMYCALLLCLRRFHRVYEILRTTPVTTPNTFTLRA